MISGIYRSAALALVSLALFGSLLATTALAASPSKHKPPKTTRKPPAKENTKALIEAGKKVYAANQCEGCHTINSYKNGQGGNTGPNLTKVGADPKHTSKWLEVAVTDPKAHNPDATMPPFKDKIKGKDLKALVAYLSSLKK